MRALYCLLFTNLFFSNFLEQPQLYPQLVRFSKCNILGPRPENREIQEVDLATVGFIL
jgi:hypothetical protein